MREKRGGKGERWEEEGRRSRDKNRKVGQEGWVSMHRWQRDHGET